MYDRNVSGEILDFEASGALYHSALVMQDDQTESFWALMSSSAIGGPRQGETLRELPIAEKTTWLAWRAKHPNTLVLVHEGQTHLDNNPYDNYFTSDKTFRPVPDPDQRLEPKASIFSFRKDGKHFAITHQDAIGGWLGRAGSKRVFVYREEGDSMYRSTRAFLLEVDGEKIKLKRKKKRWIAKGHGEWDRDTGRFSESGKTLAPLEGFDTFWYIWSQYHPETEILARPALPEGPRRSPRSTRPRL